MTVEIYEVIILGGGVAGLTAGLYTARAGLKTLAVDRKALGGRLNEIPVILNFPGFPEGILGYELSQRMVAHAQRFGVELRYPEDVVAIEFKGEQKLVRTRTRVYQSDAVIVATGTQRRRLLVQGEAEYLGRGVSYCAVCDAPLIRDMRVAVVGYGDEAVDDVLLASDFANSVFLVFDREEIEAGKALKLRVKTNITLLPNSKVTMVEGDGVVVKSIRLLDVKTGTERSLPVEGVFIALGVVPMTELTKNAGVEVDERGCIKVTRRQHTNIEGVYAAGDCTCGGMQVVTAAGEGAVAGISAVAYVKKLKRKI